MKFRELYHHTLYRYGFIKFNNIALCGIKFYSLKHKSLKLSSIFPQTTNSKYLYKEIKTKTKLRTPSFLIIFEWQTDIVENVEQLK